MSKVAKLSTLERVEVRDCWQTEPQFSDWLAQPDNLKVLSETLGLELEAIAREQEVGVFRADIVCVDGPSERRVLIENQLEKTDHDHLGKLMTYAAGLSAVTVVWIGCPFTEEHRAALDWLNHVTTEQVEFFGVEIELWRIGDSAPAPRFNIVAKPNDWAKAVSTQSGDGEPSELKLLQRDYWSELGSVIKEMKSTRLRMRTPRPQQWTDFSIGVSSCGLTCRVNTFENFAMAGVYLTGALAHERLDELESDKQQIEAEFGEPLEWYRSSRQGHARIKREGFDIRNRGDWKRQHAEMALLLEKFHRVFADRLRQLAEDDTE
jgi:hypothetical protein